MTRDRERTKARIIDAVSGLLTRSGFRAVGVNAVAEAAGVDKVLIYRYFGGLAGLLSAVADEPSLWPTVDEVLAEAGVTDLERYAVSPGHELLSDIFLDDPPPGVRPQPE